MCPKGRALGRSHHNPAAITRPLMRKNGELVPVSWDECLDDLAARLRKVVDTYGPNAVGVFFGSGLGMDASGYRLADIFYKSLGTPPKFSPLTIDGTAKVLVSSLIGGFPGLNLKTDNDNVDMLLYVGVNPMVSHGHNTGMFNPAVPIRAAARRGEVWTIDPLRTKTAKFSTRHIAPYPGKDYAILAWLAREILEGGPINLAQPVSGMEELRAALAGFDRTTAAAIAGIAEHELDDLLTAIRSKGHVVVEREHHAMARLGTDDPHGHDEPQGRRVVPSRLHHPVRQLRAADHGQSVFTWCADHARCIGHHWRLALRGAAR